MITKLISKYFSSDLAIDLGSANTVVYAKERGIVVSEPSVIAVNRHTNTIEAVGRKAFEAFPKNSNDILLQKPLREGVITEFSGAETLLRYCIRKANTGRLWRNPRVIISLPVECTEVERNAIKESARRAGISKIYLIDDMTLAAIGTGLLISEPLANMLVDIGGGTTGIAVFSRSGYVYNRTVRIAGDEMTESIIQYIKRKYNLLIGDRTAEIIKVELGSAFPLEDPISLEVRGRNIIEGIPKTITISDEEVREALADAVATIVNAIRVALERLPPEIASDVVERGISITGGGALLKNMDRRLSIETGLPISRAEQPMLATALGGGTLLSSPRLLKNFRQAENPSRIKLTERELKLNVALYVLYIAIGVTFTTGSLARWGSVSKPISSGISFLIVTLLAYPLFVRGTRMKFAWWEYEERWTLSRWAWWSVIMAVIGYVLGYTLQY